MNKQPISRARAEHRAAVIRSELEPLCERFAIAGSVRRGDTPNCGDLDIVVLNPAPAFFNRILSQCQAVEEGSQNRTYCMSDGWEIGVYIATSESRDLLGDLVSTDNFGTLLLSRTGPRTHNIKLADIARNCGLRWNPYVGLFKGRDDASKSPYPADRLILTRSESEVYYALGLNYIPPESRMAWSTEPIC